MNRPFSWLAAAAAFGFLACCGSAHADIHHNGLTKISGKGDGKHQLQAASHNYVAHAIVSNGMVKGVTATHKGTSVAVTKFKTGKKYHAQAGVPNGDPLAFENGTNVVHIFAATSDDDNAVETASAQIIPLGATTSFVGYGIYNTIINQWVVYWFPVNAVQNGDLGASVYGGGILPAPTGGPTVLNTNGFCPVGQAATYNVQLQAGKQYYITLKTVQPTYHPFLAVYSINGQLLAQDVDSAGFPNARILFTPLTTGTYKIGCGSLNNATGGTFTLTVQ